MALIYHFISLFFGGFFLAAKITAPALVQVIVKIAAVFSIAYAGYSICLIAHWI